VCARPGDRVSVLALVVDGFTDEVNSENQRPDDDNQYQQFNDISSHDDLPDFSSTGPHPKFSKDSH
jgi:hypothetical protein